MYKRNMFTKNLPMSFMLGMDINGIMTSYIPDNILIAVNDNKTKSDAIVHKIISDYKRTTQYLEVVEYGNTQVYLGSEVVNPATTSFEDFVSQMNKDMNDKYGQIVAHAGKNIDIHNIMEETKINQRVIIINNVPWDKFSMKVKSFMRYITKLNSVLQTKIILIGNYECIEDKDDLFPYDCLIDCKCELSFGEMQKMLEESFLTAEDICANTIETDDVYIKVKYYSLEKVIRFIP